MKEKILKLRSEGKTYKEIIDILRCSKSLVCYYCNPTQKEKYRIRTQRRRKQHPFSYKTESFLYRSSNPLFIKKPTYSIEQIIKAKIYTFHRISINKERIHMPVSFTYKDVINKFGENPVCYLTGDLINIYSPRSYEFDHIIPKSRGGTNTLDNLGICTKIANNSKDIMTPDEYINHCKKVLSHYGYEITKKQVDHPGTAPDSFAV